MDSKILLAAGLGLVAGFLVAKSIGKKTTKTTPAASTPAATVPVPPEVTTTGPVAAPPATVVATVAAPSVNFCDSEPVNFVR